MSGASGIPWTDATLNPYGWACKPVSPGCFNCYARTLTEFHRGPGAFDEPPGLIPARLMLPFTNKKFREAGKIFLASMSDPFDGRLPVQDMATVEAMMALDPRHIYQSCTKRAGVMASKLNNPAFVQMVRDKLPVILQMLASPKRLSAVRRESLRVAEKAAADFTWPLPNVWRMVSAEDQQQADLRIPHLLRTPAAIRGVSAEPLLEGVRLISYLPGGDAAREAGAAVVWVIAGGESGRGFRQMDPEWLSVLHRECAWSGTAFFAKQDSAFRNDQKGLIPDEDWVRQFPAVAA